MEIYRYVDTEIRRYGNTDMNRHTDSIEIPTSDCMQRIIAGVIVA